MNSIQEFFRIGMKRNLPQLLPSYSNNKELELGAGDYPNGTILLNYPEWDGNMEKILFDDETFDVIHAYHFFEHLDNPQHCLYECQRILKVGGHMNIVVPYYKSQLAYECLEHKSFFTEETWNTLFNKACNKYGYEWKFEVHLNLIIGIAERNLCLMTQLQKMP